MDKNIKFSETILRVSSLLLQLLQKPMNYEEMFDFYNKNFENTVYSKEVLNKYLNTLRMAGLNIERINGRYTLLNFLTQISFSKEEAEIFRKIEQAILKYGTVKNIKTFLNFKTKLIKFLDTDSRKAINYYDNTITFTTKLGLLIKQYNQLCEDKQKIKIKYRSKTLTVEPEQVLCIDNKFYLECFNISDYKLNLMEIEKICLLEQQPAKNTYKTSPNTVLFELSGRLAQNYKLKEGETIIAENQAKIFVKSPLNDYEFLARRLIRYQNCCKILKPIEFKEYFKDYINEIFNIYENN